MKRVPENWPVCHVPRGSGVFCLNCSRTEFLDKCLFYSLAFFMEYLVDFLRTEVLVCLEHGGVTTTGDGEGSWMYWTHKRSVLNGGA